jgi:DNA polymerase elongation subunit (family B)
MPTKLGLQDLVQKYQNLAKELESKPTYRDFCKVVSSRQFSKVCSFNDIVRASGFEVYTPADRDIFVPPKILYFDIELSAMQVKTYTLSPDYISHKKILRDWHLYSYAGIFEGETTAYYLDNRYASDITDDRQLVEGLHDLLSKADILVGHNAQKFDLKKFNARAIKYGLPPISPKQTYDTLKMAKRLFAFSSNSLEYIAKFLQLTHLKSSHAKFPGDSLWDEIEKGNLEAWEECREYNIQDCVVTRELFHRLATYDSRVNIQAYNMERVCICGSKSFVSNGYTHTRAGKFQVKMCKSCGKKHREKENLIPKDMRKLLFH